MVLYVIALIIGIGISSYAFFEISMWGGIYFEREYLCVEKFRKKQKLCDAISAFHNLFMCYGGFLIVLSSLKLLFGITNFDMKIWFIIGFVVTVLDWLMLYIVNKKAGLTIIKENLLKQWHTQKKLTDIHNQEVNLYRGCNRITEKYPKNIIMLMGLMSAMLFILSLNS